MSHAPTVRLPPVGVVLLFLVLLLPTATAQASPPPAAASGPLSFSVGTTADLLSVPYNNRATTTLIIRDTSEDSGKNQLVPGTQTDVRTHKYSLSVANADELKLIGWDCQIDTTFMTSPGGRDTPVRVDLVNTVLVSSQEAICLILIEFEDLETSTRLNATVPITGEVAPYSRAYVTMANNTQVQTKGQFETVTYQVEIFNHAVYPDVYAVTASTDKEGFVVTAPPNVYVPPLSSRTITINVRTPHGILYEFGETTAVNVKVDSLTGVGSYTVTGVLKVEGWYIPVYIFPLILVGAVSAAVLARGSKEWREIRRLEDGRPRRVQPTPRQAVMLAAMKKNDPEGYTAYKAKMDALYKARRDQYRSEIAQVRARDKAEAKEARAEYNAATKQKKLERAEAKRLKNLEKKARKAQAKIDRKQAKIDAKERKKLEKELRKKQKKLGKKKAKLDKAAAKQAVKDAKAQAKADKAAVKLAKKEAKLARKKGRDGQG